MYHSDLVENCGYTHRCVDEGGDSPHLRVNTSEKIISLVNASYKDTKTIERLLESADNIYSNNGRRI